MREIRLLAVPSGKDGKDFQRAPFYFSPKQNPENKKWMTGQKIEWVEDTKDEKKFYRPLDPKSTEGLALVISPNESYVAKHLMRFNMDLAADKILYEFFKTHDDIIADNKNSITPGKHRFYFEDKEEEAKATISSVDMEYQALTKIKEMNSEQKRDFARVIGIGRVGELSEIQIDAALMDKAKSMPKVFMLTMEDPDMKVRSFIKKLIEKNILKLTAGKYMYNNEILGLNERAVIDYLKNKENTNMVSEFGRLLKQDVPVTV